MHRLILYIKSLAFLTFLAYTHSRAQRGTTMGGIVLPAHGRAGVPARKKNWGVNPNVSIDTLRDSATNKS